MRKTLRCSGNGSSLRPAFVLAATTALMAMHETAHANPTFIFTNSSTNPASTSMVDGFNAAALRWSSNFTNNVTIRINISSANLGSGVIGATGSASDNYSYTATRTALAGNAVSADDISSVAALPGGASFAMLINRTSDNPNGANSATPYLDNNGGANNATTHINRANAKALGLITPANAATDADMQFSSAFSFDFNPRDGVSGSAIDFQGITTHEIGHALGFVSGVDVLDGNPSGFPADAFTFVNTADLFRFSTASRAQGVGTIDFTAGTADKFFSVNGGTTLLSQFSEGQNLGDGRQASHWKDNLGIGIMDPTAGGGEKLTISEADRRLFDVIGWTRDNTWEWTYQPGGSFNEPLNWNANGIPSAAQDAVFELGQVYGANVSFTTNASVRDLIDRRDTLTLAPTSAQSITVARNFIVGDTAAATASLTLTNGLLTTPSTQIGTVATSSGTFNYTGGTWNNAGSVYLGGTSSAAGGTATLNRSSAGTFTVGGTLKVWGGGTVNASNGTTTVGTLDISSLGKVIINSGTWTVTTTLNNGLLTRLGGTSNLGTIDGAGSLAVSGVGVLTATRVRQSALSVTGGSQLFIPASGLSGATSVLSTLDLGGTPTPTGKMDLNNNFLIINAGNAGLIGSTLADATAYIKAGRGTTNGGGLYQYDTNGLSSTSAKAVNALMSFNKFALAAISNADLALFDGVAAAYSLFGGVSVSSNSILIRYTIAGDANLDGVIDAADFSLFERGQAGSIANVGWLSGDFTLDGLINGDDLAVIERGFLTQNIPEPTSVVGCVLGAALLARRARRPG